ncbi:A disintegrin and metalloproteinase with thrombospondin motifs adt-2 isoform X2 [Cimex lectularius]|uniref:Peptidase M12B domain-containing protein n=1 Tax=Cimex lectularius TaxID=79782 RepID=A0A8I6SM51_CIMLE|nr:A disintegrin and metalloproteinase with thrombospondin motifs adt-2 isoform X2 [Cimex lectularius]
MILVIHVFLFLAETTTSQNPKKATGSSDWINFFGRNKLPSDGVEIVWHEGAKGSDELFIQTHGEEMKLKLEPNTPILDPHFVLISRNQNHSELLPLGLVRPSCFYKSTEQYKAALNICDGMSGIVSSGGGHFYAINPIPETVYRRRGNWIPHLVVKRSTGRGLNIKTNDELSRGQSGRHLLPPVHVETAVFVDRDLYRHMTTNFPKNTDQQLVTFVLTMVNAVQLLYHDPSLGRPVSFVMKRLEILHSDPPALHRSEDIDRFLSNFCSWQRDENPPNDSDPLHWDHALILTGLDLYVLSKNGKISKQVVGLAPVAGMCNPTSSCTVNEGRHFESVYVVAHEIGHNLGMRHDGPLADNNCDPGSYLMSPTLGSGKIKWSSCSRNYLNQFLRTPQSHCLMDHSLNSVQLDHGGEGMLPGERFDADQQCILKYGRGSRHSSTQPIGDICQDLHCMRERFTWTSHPALEGTSCGLGKWCRSGRCLDRGLNAQQAASHVVKGGWSEWGPFSECASGCLYDSGGDLAGGSTGVMVASRFCNNPRPENGGDPCIGSDKKYKTCVPHQCSMIPKSSIQSFADEICLRAREIDSDFTGTGFQKMSSDSEEACTVWCHKRKTGLDSKGWAFPDGTTCQTSRRHTPMYCISGVCQEFKCNGGPEEIFILNSNTCSNTNFVSRDKRREVPVGVWTPISECYFNCISPGLGLQLVEKRACRYCNTTSSIQICQPNTKSCQNIISPTEHATNVCTKYSQKVRRLSGFGMQLSPSNDESDRSCRIACQDETVANRFYLVNGEEGWFPFGTDCAKGDPTKKTYCVSGKCLHFGSDGSPVYEALRNLPVLRSRYKRGIPNVSHETDSQRCSEEKQMHCPGPINFSHPIHVEELELTYKNEINDLS